MPVSRIPALLILLYFSDVSKSCPSLFLVLFLSSLSLCATCMSHSSTSNGVSTSSSSATHQPLPRGQKRKHNRHDTPPLPQKQQKLNFTTSERQNHHCLVEPLSMAWSPPQRSLSAPAESSNNHISLNNSHMTKGGVANGMKKSSTPKKIVIKNLKGTSCTVCQATPIYTLCF